MKIYSIVDNRIPAIISTFCAPTDGVASREIKRLPSDSPLRMFPEDFELWCVAELDDKTFEVVPVRRKIVDFSVLLGGGDNE